MFEITKILNFKIFSRLSIEEKGEKGEDLCSIAKLEDRPFAMNIKNAAMKAGTAVLAAGMVFSSVVPALAAETKTITIKGKDGQSLAGKSFNVYKLFTLEKSEDGAYNYVVNSAYENVLKEVTGKTTNSNNEMSEYIDGLKNDSKALRQFSEKMRKALTDAGVTPTLTKTVGNDESDTATITVDGMGYYLIDETTNVSGQNAAASLVMMDTADTNGAEITIKSTYPSVTKKVQEDDGNAGWGDFGDYEIGQTIPYKYTSKVPTNIADFNTYKYVFHDKADACLTIDTDSIKVTIGGTAVDSSKYTVSTTPGDGDTFDISFTDLKTAVDGLVGNEDIVVTYNGKINENAANKAGRASSFENSVVLEFSNDARDGGGETGSTGKTPEDVVTVFTYKLTGLKVNTDQTALKDAKFHLYTDENCTKEVKTTANANGTYVVNNTSTATAGADIVSDSNGNFVIAGLDQGTYYLKETEAPTGYKTLTSPLAVTITPTYSTDRDSYTKEAGKGETILKSLSATVSGGKVGGEKVEADVATGNISVTVTNKKGTKLPATGSVMTLVMLGAGIAIVYVANKKRTQED